MAGASASSDDIAFLLDVRFLIDYLQVHTLHDFPRLARCFLWLNPSTESTKPGRLAASHYLPLIAMIARFGRSDEKNQPTNTSASASSATTIVILTVLTSRSAPSARTLRINGGMVISFVALGMLAHFAKMSNGA
jgi:hypothetical protein